MVYEIFDKLPNVTNMIHCRISRKFGHNDNSYVGCHCKSAIQISTFYDIRIMAELWS